MFESQNEKKVVLKLWQEVKVKVNIITRDDIKIYYTGKFKDFIVRYIIKYHLTLLTLNLFTADKILKHFQLTNET